jgi:hypothetical protein
MVAHPPINGRRKLQGDLRDIYHEMLVTATRLDMLGEHDAAALIVKR